MKRTHRLCEDRPLAGRGYSPLCSQCILGPPIFSPCGYCKFYLGWGEGEVELCTIKQTVMPQLSVHTFIQCIWTAVHNSVPKELLFHSLYTKHKTCPTEHTGIKYGCMHLCNRQIINVQWTLTYFGKEQTTVTACNRKSYGISRLIWFWIPN
jgi:hypothetical protein